MKVPFERALEIALESPKVQAALGGKKIKKVIYIPDKLINIVPEEECNIEVK